MGYVIKTSIGRMIDPNQSMEIQGDGVLRVLYDTHYNPFDDDSIPTNLRLLSNAIGLDEKRTKDVCEFLFSKKMVEKVTVGDKDYYKINANGINFVESWGG